MTDRNTWALVTLASESGPIACLETETGCYRLEPSLARAGLEGISQVHEVLADWENAKPALERAVQMVEDADRVSGSAHLSPTLRPGKILCAGANYHAHLTEMGVTGDVKDAHKLFFFFKPADTSLVGEGETVRMPIDSRAMDWEVELAIVIGRKARAVSVEDALDHVAGYTLAIDFSARDLNRAPDTFFKLDWVAGKAHDSSCPLGPRIVPPERLIDLNAQPLSLSVNGATKQDDTTGDMIFSMAEQISKASRIMTLNPGDIILTGTPAGVGAARKEFLSVGDRVEAHSPGIGTLAVTIQPSDA